MARWSLSFTPAAEKDLARLDRAIRRRIIDKLDWLLERFDALVPSALHADFKEFYKLRVGDWRVVYRIGWPDRVISVRYIDRRDKIYKKK